MKEEKRKKNAEFVHLFFCKDYDNFKHFIISEKDFRVIILKEPSNLFLAIHINIEKLTGYRKENHTSLLKFFLLWEFPVKMVAPFLEIMSCMVVILCENFSFG